jgi:hypothetical protein
MVHSGHSALCVTAASCVYYLCNVWIQHPAYPANISTVVVLWLITNHKNIWIAYVDWSNIFNDLPILVSDLFVNTRSNMLTIGGTDQHPAEATIMWWDRMQSDGGNGLHGNSVWCFHGSCQSPWLRLGYSSWGQRHLDIMYKIDTNAILQNGCLFNMVSMVTRKFVDTSLATNLSVLKRMCLVVNCLIM